MSKMKHWSHTTQLDKLNIFPGEEMYLGSFGILYAINMTMKALSNL